MKKLDFSTIFTFIICFILMIIATISNNSITYFFNIDALIITLVGSFAATLLTYSFSVLISSLKYIKFLFVKNNVNNAQLVFNFIQLSKVTRKKGLIGIEDKLDSIENPLMKKGLNLLLLNQSKQKIKKILKKSLEETSFEYEKASHIFSSWANYATAFGMIGTIIGMIQMVNNMSDPASLYSGFGKAFLTTFYGVLLANLLFIPISKKLSDSAGSKQIQNEIVLEGCIGIKEDINNRILKETLFSYLTKEEREEYIALSAPSQEAKLKLIA